ncbi:MAG: DUF4147 domain-containing protein [Thermomicrobiales bacterium]|nr:DUF4147 domain-containing protein [Thermomicrobiales bacterium]MCO5220910.1 DUF4147 domain-containing protein [Thermomicrobiales bacterium]
MSTESPIEFIFRDVLPQLDPRRTTQDALRFEDGNLTAAGRSVPVAGKLVVVAIGKAAIAMAAGAQDALGAAFERGYVLTVDGPDAAMLDDRWRVLRGGHPIPDQRGIDATRTIIDAVEELEPDDVILALISGGGSALFESPHEPLTLDDFAALTRLLLNAGAPIQHLNTVRIPLSDVKGGSFRQRSRAAVFVTLILSDVLGNNPQIIASGPTVEPATSGAAALAILDLYGLRDVAPPAVRTVLNEAAATESEWSYPSDFLSIIGDNHRALELAQTAARSRGIESDIVWTERQGEASDLGREWVAMLLNLPAGVRMAWGGGEATVTVRGEGNGGRNTEFALAAALELDRLENDDWIVASLATDGQDATTGSAGAIASRQSILRGRELGLDPQDFLDRNDSATFFVQTGDLIVTGPSGTNVNDLYVGLRKP